VREVEPVMMQATKALDPRGSRVCRVIFLEPIIIASTHNGCHFTKSLTVKLTPAWRPVIKTIIQMYPGNAGSSVEDRAGKIERHITGHIRSPLTRLSSGCHRLKLHKRIHQPRAFRILRPHLCIDHNLVKIIALMPGKGIKQSPE